MRGHMRGLPARLSPRNRRSRRIDIAVQRTQRADRQQRSQWNDGVAHRVHPAEVGHADHQHLGGSGIAHMQIHTVFERRPADGLGLNLGQLGPEVGFDRVLSIQQVAPHLTKLSTHASCLGKHTALRS